MTAISDTFKVVDAIVDYNLGKGTRVRDVEKAVKAEGYRSYGRDDSVVLLSEAESVNFIAKSADLLPPIQTTQTPKISGHPDFDHFTSEETEIHEMVTLFADLRNFTTFAMFLDLKEVAKIKKTVIQALCQIAFAFNGHVHDIPGDGVMVFFGRKKDDFAEACQQAIFAGAFMQYAIISKFNAEFRHLYDMGDDSSDLSLRIGVEYGTDILWGHYGVLESTEIKGTGFPVDFAAKIQQLASENEIRLGEGMLAKLPMVQAYTSETLDYTKRFQHREKTYKHHKLDWQRILEDIRSGKINKGKSGSISSLLRSPESISSLGLTGERISMPSEPKKFA